MARDFELGLIWAMPGRLRLISAKSGWTSAYAQTQIFTTQNLRIVAEEFDPPNTFVGAVPTSENANPVTWETSQPPPWPISGQRQTSFPGRA